MRGQTHGILEPMELTARLSSVIAPPRYRLVRFAGVFAAGSSWRELVVSAYPPLRRFFRDTLNRPEVVKRTDWMRVDGRFPDILTPGEVARVIHHARMPKQRAMLTVMSGTDSVLVDAVVADAEDGLVPQDVHGHAPDGRDEHERVPGCGSVRYLFGRSFGSNLSSSPKSSVWNRELSTSLIELLPRLDLERRERAHGLRRESPSVHQEEHAPRDPRLAGSHASREVGSRSRGRDPSSHQQRRIRARRCESSRASLDHGRERPCRPRRGADRSVPLVAAS